MLYETQFKKHVKTVSQKLCFKLNFLMSPIVHNTVWFVTKHLAAFVAPQTHKQLQNKHNLKFRKTTTQILYVILKKFAKKPPPFLHICRPFILFYIFIVIKFG